MSVSRRVFLGGAAIAVLGVVSYQVFPTVFERPLEFEVLDKPEGFRRMAGGLSSYGYDPFFGLKTGSDPAADRALAYVKRNVCKSLFGPGAIEEGVVRIASFSDYYCPYCRVLTQRLGRLEAESAGMVQITWHELPLLGDASELAAKAAIAARKQGAYTKFHQRLMKTSFRVNPAYLEAVSDSIGVDYEVMLRDIASADVARELRENAALVQVFSFIGTPAIVIGRTVIQGEISDRTLERLVELERKDGPSKDCGDA